MPLPLFGKSHKSPPDIVKNLKEALTALEKGDKKSEKAQEEVNRSLQAVKGVIYGHEGQEPQTEQVAQLAQETYNANVLPMLIKNLVKLDFESKKDVALFEAFHVFKVFVANPNKPKPIAEILLRNREKLVDFLTNFHTDRTEDEQFNDEKAYLIKQIQEMK
uniref:Uncharacterized protein n=1 Tax=Plectus sambesii TaxID=2011161 RepID=A0A914WHU2_9BILA